MDEVTLREKEWQEIEDLVICYQLQFEEYADKETIVFSKNAAEELLNRFMPLLRKYCILIKNGQIDFEDPEMKAFIMSFISDKKLQLALENTKQKAEQRADIYKRFNFVKETYGQLPEEEITIDLQYLLLILAKRYKPMGKSFCGYVYQTYKFEVSRHIKKFIQNPLNISYKTVGYEDCLNGLEDNELNTSYEDTYYEDSTGLPDMDWIAGKNCSEAFTMLLPLERKILIKYYLEEWNDRQISEYFGIHINTVNQKRRQAINKVAETMNIDLNDIKRNRRSGKKAILPTD